MAQTGTNNNLKFLMLVVAFTFGWVHAEVPSDKELELVALTTFSGSERKAQRMHRTIERYRKWRERSTTSGIRHLLAMSNLAKSLAPPDRDTVWQIVHRTLDLEAYIDSEGQLAKTVTEPYGEDDPYIEEMVVVGNIFDHMPMDPAEFSVDDIRAMRAERLFANEWYSKGEYDKAYPILLDLAKRGFKDSQSRLAYILFNGTQTVKKSNMRALGWLGAAAYGDTEPQFRVLFRRYMDEVPESVHSTVSKVVTGYQQSFAHDDFQNCSTEHYYAHGRVKRTFCRFKLEAIAEACENGSFGTLCWAHAVNQRE